MASKYGNETQLKYLSPLAMHDIETIDALAFPSGRKSTPAL